MKVNKNKKTWDLFICHASEDKNDVAHPLAQLLSMNKISVWYDEFSLTLGDSLRRSIDKGLTNSRYGLVILSPAFFQKEWPQKELDGLAAREIDGTKVILPIWHNITKEQVIKYSPMLADKLAVSTNLGMDMVVDKITRAIQDAQDTILSAPSKVITKRKPKTVKQSMNLIPSPIPSISTGSIALDYALGTGGWPNGHIIEIYSPPSTGKTTLCLSAAYQAQLAGVPVLYVDADYGMIKQNLIRCKIDPRKIKLTRPKNLEDAFESVFRFLNSKKRGLVVIDSIANLLTSKFQSDDDRNFNEQDQHHRTIVTQYLQLLQPKVSFSGSIIILTNRLIDRVGIMFGNPESTPWATLSITDIASIRIDLRRIQMMKLGDDSIGQVIKAKVTKNRFFTPFKVATFNLMFDSGIDYIESIFSMAVDHKIVKKTSGIFSYKGKDINDRRNYGSEGALKALSKDDILLESIKNDLSIKLWSNRNRT